MEKDFDVFAFGMEGYFHKGEHELRVVNKAVVFAKERAKTWKQYLDLVDKFMGMFL